MLIFERFAISFGNLACGILSMFFVACLIVTMGYTLCSRNKEKALPPGIVSFATLTIVGIFSVCVTHIYKWLIIDVIFLFIVIIATVVCLKPKK